MQRRGVILAGVATSLAAAGVQAQAERPPLKILVGFPPGGSADTIARLLAERMREALGGQNVVVDNKPGAAGRIAIDQLKNAAPDGQTVLVMPSGPVVLFPHVFKRLGYDVNKDLAPISQLAGFQFAVVSGPKSNVKSVAEMLAKAKADPSTASYGSSGNGTVPHFLGVMLADAAGVPLQHVPYQGGAPAMNALLGGHIGYNIDVVSEALEQHRAGKVRIIAVAGATRSPLLPDVPTLREQGVAMDATAWFAMYGPGALPREQAARIQQAVATAMKDPALRQRFEAIGLEPIGSTPEQLAAVQKADLAKWEKPVKATGYQAD
ncbi:MAG: Bug family tripartite tricarboxylate transporter substrate binding protein [Rubrivivax sp.]|jgi:tripartite-type tricarboxylate transporter receptor subunit TctC|nr:Bug family tripartite tricarboxylate transporter substrate binding protein [Rubrivivax sp.]